MIPEILRDLSIIALLAHCLIMFMMLYESRFSCVKTYAALISLYTVAVTIMLLVVHLYGIQTAGRVMVLVCILPSFILFLFMAKNRGARFLFTFCLVDTLMLVIMILSRLLDALLGDPGVALFLIRLLLPLLMEYLLVKYVRKPYLRLQRIAKQGWLAYSLLSVMFYLTILIDTFYPRIVLERVEEIPQLVMVLLLVPAMYLTIFTALGRQLALMAGQERQRALEFQIKLIGDRQKLWEEKEQSLNILKHDLKHQMLLLDDYIKNQEYEKAQAYIGTLTEHIDKSVPKNYCKNRAVNVVLSYYQSVAQEKGIVLNTVVNLPETLRVDETDLAVILSNGLDNAIRALESCPDKTVSVKAFAEAGTLYLEIKNPFRDSVIFEDGIPLSRHDQHGYLASKNGVGNRKLYYGVTAEGDQSGDRPENAKLLNGAPAGPYSVALEADTLATSNYDSQSGWKNTLFRIRQYSSYLDVSGPNHVVVTKGTSYRERIEALFQADSLEVKDRYGNPLELGDCKFTFSAVSGSAQLDSDGWPRSEGLYNLIVTAGDHDTGTLKIDGVTSTGGNPNYSDTATGYLAFLVTNRHLNVFFVPQAIGVPYTGQIYTSDTMKDYDGDGPGDYQVWQVAVDDSGRPLGESGVIDVADIPAFGKDRKRLDRNMYRVEIGSPQHTPRNTGSYTTVVTDISGGYIGIGTLNINARTVGTITLDQSGGIYTGVGHLPTATVTDSEGQALVLNRDYVLEVRNAHTHAVVSSPVDAGTYEYTARGINN